MENFDFFGEYLNGGNEDNSNISHLNYSPDISFDNFENEYKKEKEIFVFHDFGKIDEVSIQNTFKEISEKENNIFNLEKKTSPVTKIPLFKIITMKKQGRERINENGNDINIIKDSNKAESIDDNNSANTHDKFNEDNLMRKIKSNISNYILTKLNDSLEDKKYKFFKCNKLLNEDLEKKFNIELLDRTIMDIVSNTALAEKYKKADKNWNNQLVQKILEENRESKVITILNKKYIDIINKIRFDEHTLYFFLKKIREKEKGVKQKYNFDIEKYIKSIKDLLYNYEKYFNEKVGRKKRLKKKKK